MAEIFKLKYVTFHCQQSVVFGCVLSSEMCSEMALYIYVFYKITFDLLPNMIP